MVISVLALTQSGCGGGRGGRENADGTAVSTGLKVAIKQGNNQVVKKNAAYPLPLVARIESPAGDPVPDMNITCKQTTSTDAVITGPTTFRTNFSGLIQTTVTAPSTYDQIVKIECRINGTQEYSVFTLETAFTVDHIEWVTAPPIVHTASHTVAILPFTVQMIDTDLLPIDVTGGTKHWIDITVDSPNRAPLGTLRASFVNGIATFNDVFYIQATPVTPIRLRATYPRANKTVTQDITVSPNVTTQSIAVLPGQNYLSGAMTLSEAITGTISALNTDNDFTVAVRATDAYFNTTAEFGAVSVLTPIDLADTEPAASTFTGVDPITGAASGGYQTFTISPVQAKSGHYVRPVTALATNNDSNTFTVSPGAPTNLIVRLAGETFNPGQTSLAAAITGAPTQQVAGVQFAATVLATDSEFNLVSSTPTVSVTTSDAADTHPASAALAAGQRAFNLTNITSGNTTITPSAAGYAGQVSNTYNVLHNIATKIVIDTQPAASIEAGADIEPIAHILDTYNNLVTTGPDATAAVTMSLFSGTGALAGTVTTNAVGGVVDFTGVGAYANLIGAKVIRLTKADTTGSGGTIARTVNSNSFTIVHGPAAVLAWSTQPADPTGAGLEIAPEIEIQDAYTNIVTSGPDATASITLSLQSGTGILLGSLTKAASGGVVDFAGEGANIEVTGIKKLQASKASTLPAGTGIITSNSADFTIIHGTATQIVLATPPSNPTIAGDEIPIVAEIQDTYGNVVYSGPDATATITLSLQAGTGSLGGLTSQSAIGGVADFTGYGVEITTTGTNKKIRATKASTMPGGTVSYIVDSANFDVIPAALDHFTVTGITDPHVAGVTTSPTVTAYDVHNNIKTDYVGTITFSSDDVSGSVILPANYTFLAGDNGTKTFTNGVTLVTAGERYVRVTDGAVNDEQSAITVQPAALDHFTVTGITDPHTAGTSTSPTVTAYDVYNNVKTNYTGTIAFSSDHGAGKTLPANYTFLAGDNGTKTFTNGVILVTTGNYYVRVTDGAVNDEQAGITVNPAALDHFTVTGIADPHTAGTTTSPTVTAYDVHNNVKTDYTGTITFSSDHGAGKTLPADYTFLAGDNGSKTFTNGVTLVTVGNYYVRVTDGAISDEQTGITVNPGALDHFTVTGITDPHTAGSATSPVVTAYDAHNNIKTDYTGTITFSSDHGAGKTLPADYTFLAGDNGTKTFTGGVTLVTTGDYYVRVTDGAVNDEQAGVTVIPAALDHFTVTGITDPHAAGTFTSPTVTAYDVHNNIKTNYTGTITFSSDHGAGKTLPANYTFLAGDNGAKTFTNGVRLVTPGDYYVRVTDGAIDDEQAGITVTPAALDHFTVAGISDPTVAGTPETVTVTAYDSLGNIKTDYTGTITFSSDHGAGKTLPADYTFLAGDAGSKIFVLGVTLVTTGDYYVRVTDGAVSDEQSGITVNPAALDHFTVTGITDPHTAGTATSPTVTAYDVYNNVKTNYTGTIAFSSDHGAGKTLPANYTFLAGDNGTKTFTNGVILVTVGNYYVRVTDGAVNDEQAGITVNPAALDHFTVAGIADPHTAGTTTSPVVTAYDVHNNVKTDYTGTITFSSDHGAGKTLPADYTFLAGDNGTKTFTNGVTLVTTGNYYVRVTDGAVSDEQTGITVNPGALDHFTVTGITDPHTAGSNTSPTVTAYDVHNNIKTDYVGTITFSSDHGVGKTLPANYTFLAGDNGTKTFTGGVTLVTVGDYYVRVTDGAVNDEQAGITVTPAALDHFTVSGISDPTVAGTTETVTVTAYDTLGNIKTDYTGTITFSSDHGAGKTLPANYTFLAGDNGAKTFTNGVTLVTTGDYYVRVTDGAISDEQAAITVTPATLDHFTVTGITDPHAAGTTTSPVVTAYDVHNNVKTNYTGTITFSSDHGAGKTLPADYTFLAGDNGTKTFTNGVTLVTVGNYYVRVTDGAVSDEQTGITVTPAALDHFTVTGITDPHVAGTTTSPVVTAYDVHNNIKTDYTGTITFSSDHGAGKTLPADYTFLAGDNGTKTFTNGVTLVTTGDYYIRVTDGAVNDEQAGITVTPAALDHFTVTGITDPHTAGTTTSPVVTAYDVHNNVKTNYTGTITFSSDHGAGKTLPADYTFLAGDNGTKTFTNGVTLVTVGNYYVRVTDGAISDEQTGITVTPAALDHFTVTGITDPHVAGTTTSPVVTAYDAHNNIKTDYTGTITFSSDHGAGKTLPADYTFLAGDNGTKTFTNGVTLVTTGDYYVRVTDGAVNDEQASITVTPAALDHFTVTGIADPHTAGTTTSPVVTAYDVYNNVKTNYTGTISFSSDHGLGKTLPADYTFLAGDNGTKTFTNGVTLVTVGDYYVRVTDGAVSDEQTGITVTPAALDHFTVAGISDPTVAGTPETVTVTAYDTLGNIKTDYTGTITFSSDHGAGKTLPANYTFLAGDAGSKTFAVGVTLVTVGDYYVRVTDGAINDEQAGITVTPAALDHFTVSGISDPHVAGTTTSPTVTAYDSYNNVKTNYTGTIAFSSDHGAGKTLPANYTFLAGDNGTKTFTNGVTLVTTGDYYVRVTDGAVNDEQAAITVTPTALDHFTVTGITDPHVAGTTTSPVVTAYDVHNNVKTDYTGTIAFSSDHGAGKTLPANYTFLAGDNGTKTFTNGVTLVTTGDYYVRVTDGAINNDQTAITVNPAALDHFTVTGITDPHAAGTNTSPTVTAYDVYNNIKTDYTGTIAFSSDHGVGKTLPANYTFLAGDNGTKTFTNGVILVTAGDYYVRVTDGAVSDEQTGITVTPAALDHFTVAGIGDPHVAGVDQSVTVTAYDTLGNIKTDYTGTITFSSDHGAGKTLPADYTFLAGDNGAKTFTNGVNLVTVGNYYVRVADGLITGEQTGISVTPAALDHFTVTGITDPHTAGTTTSPVVTAYDVFNNVKTNYTGTIIFSSDHGAGKTLPADYTFLAGDNGTKTFTNGVTLVTVGTYYVRVTDGAVSDEQTGITVTPAALDHFTVTGIADPHAAGTTTSPVVTAYDVHNNVKTDYTGTITFSSDHGAGKTLPADYTFLAGDNGTKTFTNGVTLVTVGTYYVRVTDGAVSDEQTGITVNPAALDHFTVSGISDPTVAGTPETVTVTAYDSLGNIKTDYTGTIAFSSDHGAGKTLPPNYTFLVGDAGSKMFAVGVTLVTVGDYYVRVTDGTVNDEQAGITVTPAALDHFTVTGITDPHTAGTTTSPVVTAYDAYNNVKTNYTGTITFSSDHGAGKTLPADYTFLAGDNGTKTFTNGVTLVTTGDYYVRVTDGAVNDEQTAITVNPAALDHFTVTGITDPHAAGTTTSPVVTAYDAHNNVKTDYTGTISFSSDHGVGKTLPANYTFLAGDNGTKTFTNGVTLVTPGDYYVRVTDGAVNDEQAAITVTPAALDHFTVTGISDPHVAGVAQSVTVTAYDTLGNIKTDYTGTITFSSDHGAGKTLPADYTFLAGDNGAKTFTNGVTLVTTGDYYVRVTDGAINDDQTAITVTPAALDHFTVTGITDPHAAGTTTSPVVTAYDVYNNVKTDYTGTIAFSSDHGLGKTLPANYTFLAGDNGTKTFTNGVTLVTAGDYYVRVTDGAVNDEQAAITVTPAGLDHFTVSGISDPTVAGTPETVTVTAYDSLGNIKTDYTGTIAFSSDHGAGKTLPANYTFLAGDAGSKTFAVGVTLVTTGDYYVRVTDGAVNDEQAAITVTPAALDHFTVTGITDPHAAGTTTSPVVTAYDSYNNVKTDYTGTISFSSDHGAGKTLPANYTFLAGDNGTKTFTNGVTLVTVGDYYVRVTDGAVNDEQAAITVTPAALDHFTVTGIADPHAAGTTTSPVVTAYDAHNNVKTDYTGTIAFSSDHGAGKTLPANYTFLAGDNGTKTFTNGVTLVTTGDYYVRVTDGAVNDEQAAITVTPAALDHFTVTGITDPHAAGTTTSPVVTAYDAYNNVKTDYTGTITFSSDHGVGKTLPADYTFLAGDNGTKTFTNGVTLVTVGDYYVRVTDGGVSDEQTGITVTPAALDHFTVTGIGDPHAAGVAQSVTVTAYDTLGNIKADYTGTISFSSDHGAGKTLPADYTFLAGDNGTKTFTNGVTLVTTGDYYVRVTDGAVNDEQAAITVTPAALDHFTVTGITDPHTAGTTTSPVVTAYDVYNNVKTDYTGTISFSSDHGAGKTLPANYTFLAGDNGTKTFTNGVTLVTVGDYYVRVTDGAVNDEQAAITVQPGALDHFTVTGITDPHVAGTTTSPVVTAYDVHNNVKTDYTGTITFSSDHGAGKTLPANYTFLAGDNGTKTFTNGVTLVTTGDYYVRVTDGAVNDEQAAITVTPAALDHFTVTGITDPHAAGTTTSPVVTAYDSYNNVKTDYTGTISFSSDHGAGKTLPANYTFLAGDNGTKTFTNGVTLVTVGDYYVRVTDGAVNDEQTAITVQPGALDHFTVTGITDPHVAGTTTSPVVTAYDVYNNVKTDYTGTITFSSDHGAGKTLPANYTFLAGDNGTKTFTNGVTLVTTGDYYVRVTDGAVNDEQAAITVTPAALDHFTVTGITDPHAAGTTTSPVVTAYDVYNNVKTDYTGTIAFSSDHGVGKTLPANYTFLAGDNGTKTFTNGVTLVTAGDYYVRVTDGAVNDEQAAITVTPAGLDHFTVSGISDPTVAGTPETVTVTAYDSLGNIKTDYTGTITFSSDHGAGKTLPADYTFLAGDNGTKTFTNGVTLVTTGDYYVRVTDGAVNDEQSAITVTPAALDHFTVTGITDPHVAGTTTSPVVTAYDVHNNVKTDYTGTITFSSDHGAGKTLPANYTFLAGDNGTKTFSNGVTLVTTGDYYLRVTDGAVNDEQAAITVTPAALDHFTVSGITDPHAAGTTTSPVVTAYDVHNNVKTDYTGTIAFSSDHGAGKTLPTNYTFLAGDNGTKTFTNGVTLVTTGDYYVRVTDGAVNDEQAAITVTPAALDHFTVTGITDPHTAGTTTSPVVTAYDVYNNVKTDYTGTIAFSSDHGAGKTLPANYTFLAGDNGTKTFTNGVTLVTTGDYYVRVTDGAVNDEQAAITVTPAALDHFTVTGITDPHPAGTTTSPVVTAYDVHNNVKTDYTGTITFSSDHGAGKTLPANYTFLAGDNGTKTFTNGVTLVTTGDYYVRVTDGAVNDEQAAITVTPAALDHFTVTGITDPHTAGTTTSPVVTAYDVHNNVKTDYTGTIAFSSDHGAGKTLPANYTFLAGDNGTKTFTNGVTLVTVGDYYVRVTDGAVNDEQAAITVTPAALDHFTVTGITDPHVAGTTTSPVVTAYDVHNNVKTDYTGTITFSSDHGAGKTLPADYTFLAGDNGTKTFTNGVTLVTTGDYYVRVTDGAVNDEQAAITVTPAALDHFTVTGITDPHSAGTTTSPVVTAYDVHNNVKTNYTGTITFSSDHGAGKTLPADYTFLAGDNGTKTFTNGVTLVTTGDYYVRVTDGAVNNEQAAITVQPGALDHFTVTGITDPHTAGTTTSPVVTAYDVHNNVKTDYTGTIAFSSDHGAGKTLPANYTFLAGDNGTKTFTNGVTLVTVGDYYVRVTDGAVNNEQAAITVTPAALDHFTVTGVADPHVAGTSQSATVTAYDAHNNIKTDYTGTITFSSDDLAATLPADYTFLAGDNGTKTFGGAITLETAGDKYIQVADGAVNGQQSSITVTPAALGSFTVTGITDPTTAGSPETVTVTAYDTYGNVKTNYTGTISFTTDDGAATLPTDYTFVLGDVGSHIFAAGVILETAGDKFVRVTDGLISGEQANITVGSAALDSFVIAGITDPHVAGTATSPTVTAYDAFGNVKTNYTGTITFTSDDGAANLPANYTFLAGDNGAKTFTNGVTLETTGDKFVQVADGAISAQQTGITVTPAALGSLTITGITDPHTAGTATSPTVTAYDIYGNVKTNYTGTITFSSDDLAATLPADYTFLAGDNGAHTFTGEVTLETAGEKYVQVADGATNAQQSNITVSPAALDSFTVSGITDPTAAGTDEDVTVTAYDVYGNIKTNYTGTVVFTSDDGAATLPADYTFLAGDNGAHTFTNGVNFSGAGTFYVRATDGLISGQQSSIDVVAPGIAVSTISGNTTESGATATFTVVLNTAPTANVTINISSGDPSEGIVSTSSLTFTTANWNSAQTVTVTGVDDGLADGPTSFSIVTGTAISADSAYNGLDPDDVAVTNNDNESTVGISVSAISGATNESGTTATFTVVLNSLPSASVTIGISSNDTGEGTVSPASLVFTTVNWDTPQTVTVTGVNDALTDGAQSFLILTAAAVSGDSDYNGLDAANVNVVNNDDETPGITVSTISGNTSEAGATATFTVVLNSQPTNNVSIPIASNDTTEGTVSSASLTFTSANWSTPQTITITGVNDALADGNQSYSIDIGTTTSADGNYNNLNPANLFLTNIDNDSTGITISSVSGMATEAGGIAYYTIALTSQPTANVDIAISSSDTGEGTVSPASVTFTTANWNVAQTVTITGVDDALNDGNQSFIIYNAAATSADGNYNGLNPLDVTLSNADNDTPGITVSSISGNTTEAGGTATFTVVLTSQPANDVTIGVSSSDATEGSVSPSSLVFTSSDWASPQTVTITGQDDALQDGNQVFTIVTAAATSTDGNYNGRVVQDVTVTNLDNDSYTINITPGVGLIVSETGTQTSVSIALGAAPTANVTIGLTSDDTGEFTVSNSSVVFTTSNWNSPQTVYLTGVDDALTDGNQDSLFVTAAATSADGNYNGKNAEDIVVTTTDNDDPNILVSPATSNEIRIAVDENGAQAVVSVVLASQPTANVTVPITSGDVGEATVSPASVVFTTANWNIPQYITVTGVNDGGADGTQTYSIQTGGATSADGNYNGFNAENWDFKTYDNDSPGIRISTPDYHTASNRFFVQEYGTSESYMMVLTSQPTATVTITLSSSDASELSVSPSTLVFTTSNWNIPQAVSGSGVDDAISDGNVNATITGSASSADGNYNGGSVSVPTGYFTTFDDEQDHVIINPDTDNVIEETMLQLSENGQWDTFTIVLSAAPSATVTCTFTSNDATEAAVSPASVTFTTANWNAPVTIYVTGVDDTGNDGQQRDRINTNACTSADGGYNGEDPPNVYFDNADND